MWYVTNEIEFRGTTRIDEFDVDKRQLTTDRGAKIEFEHLLLAPGCSPVRLKNLGDRDDELFYIRDLASAERLSGKLSELRGKGHVLILGCGYLGVELGAAVLQHGIKVRCSKTRRRGMHAVTRTLRISRQLTMAAPGGKFLPQLFTDKIAEVYQHAYAKRGATVSCK